MAVAYRSSGTIVANGDAGLDMSANLPSGLAIDDIMIFVGADADNEHFDAAMPAGWTVIHSDNTNGSLGGTVAWKRYDGTESDWQFDTPSSAGQLVMGVIHAFSGCLKIGTPWETRGENTVAQRGTHGGSIVGTAGMMKLMCLIIEDNVSVTDISDPDFTIRDNQTTTVGSDGRLLLGTSTDSSLTAFEFTTGTNEYSYYVVMSLIPETDRATIVPNTADAHDFGVDNTPTLEFTGSSANGDSLEYQVEVFSLASESVMDSYSESNQDTDQDLGVGTTYQKVGQSFTGNGEILTKATFYLKKQGNPTGNIVARLYAHTGTFGTNSLPTSPIILTSRAIDITTLTTSYALIDFVFDNWYPTTNNTKYFISVEYSGGNGSELLRAGYDSTSSSHGGNRARSDGTWSTNTADLCFYVYGIPSTELDKFSVAANSKFTNTTDALDIHPFDEGDKVSFTVTDELLNQYHTSNYNRNQLLSSVHEQGVSQSFSGIVTDLASVTFYLSKFGSPTGNAVAKLYAHTGTFGTSSIPTGSALATSDTLDVSSLDTTIKQVDFVFPTPYTISSSTKYVVTIEYSGGDGSNWVIVGKDDSAPNHEGNLATYNGSVWTGVSGEDLIFKVGQSISLADGTWYWRARAIDPSGVNQWSDWTTIRSFTITSVALTGSQIKVGSYKEIAGAQINIGGVWKTVTAIKINIGGVWKDVTI